MADEQPVSRRTALKTIAGATLVGLGASTAAASDRETRVRTVDSTGTEPSSVASPQVERPKLYGRTGYYRGTVDRIVDGEHVVILVESGGQVVDQIVVSSDDYPELDEGDSVVVLLMWGRLVAIW